MITPAYAPTATERVLPRLALDFTTGVLDPRVTVTRALNTATRVNSSGLIEIVNADLPRFDYDPVTLSPLGLLIEEQRANLLLYSEDFTAGVWAKTQSSITPSATTAPNGLVSGSKLVENTANAGHILDQSRAVTSGVTYVSSVFAKAGERTSFSFRANNDNSVVTFNLANGTAGAATNGAAFITPFGNGWFRCSLVWTATATATVVALRVRLINGSGASTYTGDGVSGLYVYGGSAEPGAFATSYIPTTTTSLTRNADVVTMTGTNLTSWLDATQGTLLSEHMVPQFNPANTIIACSLGSAAAVEIYAAIQTTGANQFAVFNTTAQANFAGFGVGTLNTPQKVCGYFKTNNFAASANGVAGGTDTSGTIPTINKLVFGARNDGARVLNGWVRKFSYWPFTLTTAEVTAFSKQ